jgi:hypothetical protein
VATARSSSDLIRYCHPQPGPHPATLRVPVVPKPLDPPLPLHVDVVGPVHHHLSEVHKGPCWEAAASSEELGSHTCRTSSSATSFGLPSHELIHVEDLRQEEVPDDHERDQTERNDHTSESVTGPDHRAHDHRPGQADQKPECRILHVAEHEVTVARRISVRKPPRGIATRTSRQGRDRLSCRDAELLDCVTQSATARSARFTYTS